jgi:hypothetical protein
MNGKRAPQQAETQLAELVYLSRALDDLGLPIRIAEGWICPADLPGFVEEIEKRVRALAGFLDTYLEEHRAAFEKADRDTAWILKCQFDGARNNFALLDQLRAMRSPAAIDFSAEAEELRKLRSGELKIERRPAPKQARP